MRPGSWSRRLAVTQLAVLASMVVTITVTALVVGPSLFDQHMREAGHDQPGVLDHAEQAFRDAGLVSLGVGLAVALAVAVTTAWVLDRRLVRGLDALAAGAARVSRGDLDHPVAVAGSGPEIERVAAQFNAMAATIASTEATRRRMLTDLAHELRTPVAVSRVTLEAVEDGVRAADSATLAVLQEQNRRLERLAGSIAEVSAAEEGRLDLQVEAVDVADLVQAARAGWEDSFTRAGVTLTTSTAGSVTVRGDRARLAQVLDNLLRNALQHTPGGGTVSVRAAGGVDTVRLAVVDDGTGIDPDDVPHVFERFYRADRSRPHEDGGGTGVGLAISRAIVRAHGGDITATSAGAGRGASFTVTLPAQGPHPRGMAVASSAQARP